MNTKFNYQLGNGNDDETTVRDLLTDLMHFCRKQNIDWIEAHGSAFNNFKFEVAKENE